MDLYCWPHNTVHYFTAREVERIVYTLTAMLFTAEQQDDGQHEEYSPKLLICPQTVLELARDSESYLEQVEQGVENRGALT